MEIFNTAEQRIKSEELKLKEEEEAKMRKKLLSVFNIVRIMINNLAEFDLIEKLFNDKYFAFTFGVLECKHIFISNLPFWEPRV